MKRIAIRLAALLLWGLPAAAQTADGPVMGSTGSQPADAPAAALPPPADRTDQPDAAGQPPPTDDHRIVEVLSIGDALSGALGAGLARVSEPGGNYDVSIRVNEESGLARPEVYDWAATLPKILDGNAYDAIVVMLGANDRQTIRDGGNRYDFGTPEWTAAYAKQVNLLLDQLAASNARVIWVAPPPMRDPDYDAAMQTVAGAQKAEVEKRGMIFLDLRKELASSGGPYMESAADGAASIVKLRGGDGISFFKAGDNLMAGKVLAALDAAERADQTPQGGKTSLFDAPEAAKTDLEAKSNAVPLFGQSVMDSAPYMVRPEGVTANAILLAAAGLGPDAALKTLRDIAPTGSGAEKLFKLGSPEAAPAGRADDFTAPPP
ncbi:MAG: DUF459 domain-containing protein [Aestuariivirga sp.]|uniref:SGNH/GDSL hydrolase family protein n=1 Tax=Aestuariivirga sp. TaxID=2650926 RepID=UPI0025C42445|nr:GDSL-type esterase/lipase family protein [Aestuariivirga sp.]MCA3560185.1 DUF459 domain-containing protein [Aestuariivirga sp.]